MTLSQRKETAGGIPADAPGDAAPRRAMRAVDVTSEELTIAARADGVRTTGREEEDKMYGVSRDALGETGPSVVSLNGIIASLAVTEFMIFKTGVPRLTKRLLRYDGVRGIVNEPKDPPQPDCPNCTQTGDGDRVNWSRHIQAGLGRWVR